jgi:NCAIR mutase (PurE)-related protein
MDPRELDALLRGVREGRVTPEEAAERLKTLPFENLGFATVDHHRALRRGFGEVLFGAGKTPDQIAAIAERIASRGQNVLITRTTREAYERVAAGRPADQVKYHELARAVWLMQTPPAPLSGTVAVVCAGTSDVPVAEEAALTAEFHGAAVERIYDVGVAGLHRLLDRTPAIRRATVVIVAAGMEGALPSVVGGLVEAPVIAVPTSVGYGASFEGLAALLAMLNSCASGVAVVNIDNGFGAGYLACSILRTARGGVAPAPNA